MLGNAEIKIWRELFSVAEMKISRRRAFAAFCLAILLHLAVWIFAPETFDFLKKHSPNLDKIELLQPDEILVPEELLPEEFRKNPNFVPENPAAPEKIPPQNTPNEAAKNQRAAQENPDKNSRERLPTFDGELEDSRAVNDKVLPRELLPPEMQNLQISKEKRAKKNAERSRENPETDAKKEKGVAVPESENGQIEAGETLEDSEDGEPEIVVPEPSERPAIAPPPGLKTLTMKSNSAANEFGAVSVDARFSEFGDYTQRILEAIQASWYVICRRSEIRTRGVVTVRFLLYSDGTVDSVQVLQADAHEVAIYACCDAVESRSPFEEWPPEMIERFGNVDEVKIRFFYR